LFLEHLFSLFLSFANMSEQKNNIDELSVNTIRLLAADMVQKANSGHPGT